jgi:hypothetical protein
MRFALAAGTVTDQEACLRSRLLSKRHALCFSGGDICHKCWGFMTVAIKVIHAALKGTLKWIGGAVYL